MTNQVYPYDTPGDYTYNSAKIAVAGGLASLKENLSDVHARWHMNESSGILVPDDSGNGRDGTTVNMEDGDWIAGKLGNCLTFNGANEWVDCGDIAGFERTTPFSLECWAKWTASDSRIFIAKMEATGDKRGWLLFAFSGQVYIILRSANGNLINVGTVPAIYNDGAWHHVVMTYSGSSTAAGVNLYVDGGTPLAKTVLQNSLTATILNSASCQIAAGSGLFPFSGPIDEAVIYDRVLTGAEIDFRFNAGSGREDWLRFADKPTIEPTVLLDPLGITSWDSFAELLGGGNEGSVGYNLYKVDKVDKYYWDGGAWVTGGSSSNYNTAVTVNANIGSFDGSPDKIGFIAYLLSDSEQKVEIDSNTIGFTANAPPNVNAGIDKSCKDHAITSPFSDCSFSDPDGTIDHVYYKIVGEVDIWTEILQGGYGTLLEAVQAWTYQFENPGVVTCQLKVEDNNAVEAEDEMLMTVEQYLVTFNIKDVDGNHLPNVQCNFDDGLGWQNKSSPVVYGFDWQGSDYYCAFDKSTYIPQTLDVTPSDHVENLTMLLMVSPESVADAVWDEAFADHVGDTSMGFILAKLTRAMVEGKAEQVGNQWIVYDPDAPGTPLVTFNTFDQDGNRASIAVYKREKV